MKEPELFKSNHLYFLGLILLVCGMPVSKFLMSISQMILALSFFVEGNFIEKFKFFFRSKAALVIAGLWLMHIVGMLYTSDLAEGWKDVRIKAPLLILTVIISGSNPISKRQFRQVLGFFIASVLVGSIISMAVLLGFTHHQVNDIRDIFIFHISHIRFALFICIAIFSIAYFLFKEGNLFTSIQKLLLSVLTVWFLIFLFIMESVTGIGIVLFTAVAFLFYFAFQKKSLLIKMALLLSAIIIPALIFWQIKKIANEYYAEKYYPINTTEKTKHGNTYSFESIQQFENGYPVWCYINLNELREEWGKRSKINFDTTDERGQHLKYTLIRFLASKGLRKDAEGISGLTDAEVRAVERGIANVNYQNVASFKSRMLQIVFEFDQWRKGDGAGGHSVAQRFQFWQAASEIIKQHSLFGVGTGDMPRAYREQYIRMNSGLNQEYRLRAHNQFLAIAVAFGIAGLLYFIFAMFYPMFCTKKQVDFFYVTFLIIALLSMLSEDTLETQAGVTFFAFFNAFFLFARKENEISG